MSNKAEASVLPSRSSLDEFPASKSEITKVGLRQWLASFNCEQYYDRFIEQGVSIDIITALQEEDLAKLVVKVGDRLRILSAISQLRDDAGQTLNRIPDKSPELHDRKTSTLRQNQRRETRGILLPAFSHDVNSPSSPMRHYRSSPVFGADQRSPARPPEQSAVSHNVGVLNQSGGMNSHNSLESFVTANSSGKFGFEMGDGQANHDDELSPSDLAIGDHDEIPNIMTTGAKSNRRLTFQLPNGAQVDVPFQASGKVIRESAMELAGLSPAGYQVVEAFAFVESDDQLMELAKSVNEFEIWPKRQGPVKNADYDHKHAMPAPVSSSLQNSSPLPPSMLKNSGISRDPGSSPTVHHGPRPDNVLVGAETPLAPLSPGDPISLNTIVGNSPRSASTVSTPLLSDSVPQTPPAPTVPSSLGRPPNDLSQYAGPSDPETLTTSRPDTDSHLLHTKSVESTDHDLDLDSWQTSSRLRPTSHHVGAHLSEYFPEARPEDLEKSIRSARQVVKRMSSIENIDHRISRRFSSILLSEKLIGLGSSQSNKREASKTDRNLLATRRLSSLNAFKYDSTSIGPDRLAMNQSHSLSSADKDLAQFLEKFDQEMRAPTRWERGKLLGNGCYGCVYMALNHYNFEFLAVKQVPLSKPSSQHLDSLKSLKNEIEVLSELEHENIVQYRGSKVEGDVFNIFLEYVPGGSLADRSFNNGEPLTESLIIRILPQILSGLIYLHERDIVHRDIKAANVLIANGLEVKISDFGLSKRVSTVNRYSMKGSPYWMAPEVVRRGKLSTKSDIWSLGCLIIEVMSGTHPFPKLSGDQAIFKIGNRIAPEIPSCLSPGLYEFVKSTLNPEPDLRPTAPELASSPILNQSVNIHN